MEKRASIIVPVCNVETYLPQCLDSILAQTYVNLEIILIDDGSPDRCGEICDEYGKKDGRIRVIHQGHQGVSAARNTGLRAATGEYLFFVDSDDWVEPDYCRGAVETLEAQNVNMVAFGYDLVDENGELLEAYQVVESRFCSVEEVHREQAKGTVRDYLWSKVYRKELFQGIRFPEGRLFEDMAVMHQLVEKSGGVYISDRCTYHYRRRWNSITHVHSDRYRIDIYEFEKQRADFYRERYPSLLPWVWREISWHALDLFKYLPDDPAHKGVLASAERLLLDIRGEVLGIYSGSYLFRLFYLSPRLFRALALLCQRIEPLQRMIFKRRTGSEQGRDP